MRIMVADSGWKNTLLQAQQALINADFKKAYTLFNKLVLAQPVSGEAHFGLGCVLKEIEQYDAAITHLSKACELSPDNMDCLFALANTFDAVNSQEDVKTLLTYIHQRFPSSARAQYELALFEKETGNYKHAFELASLITSSANSPLKLILHSYLLLLSLPNQQDWEQVQEDLTRFEKQVSSTEEKMLWQYACGNACEKNNHFEDAFEHWHHANKLQRSLSKFDTSELAPLFNEIMSIQSNELSQQSPFDASDIDNAFCPIFILGLPRTGSTLLEKLLCEYQDVSTLGEQALIANHCAAYLSHTYKQPFPLLLKHIEPNSAIKAAKLYKQALEKRQIQNKFVIDKLPANFQSIDLILSIFPNAKIIHIRRDFRDVALSIFKNHFAENEPYFCDLQELELYRTYYEEIMAHFHNKYPRALFDVNYEALVSDTEKCMQGILNYCGINTIKHENKAVVQSLRRVKTLSSTQVTAPINKQAVGSYKRYEQQLIAAGIVIPE